MALADTLNDVVCSRTGSHAMAAQIAQRQVGIVRKASSPAVLRVSRQRHTFIAVNGHHDGRIYCTIAPPLRSLHGIQIACAPCWLAILKLETSCQKWMAIVICWTNT